MKKIYLLLLFITTFGYSQVGVGTTNPSSTLDVVATNATGATTNVDGILIPRVDRQRAEAMSSIPEATMIYVNSIATGTGAGIGSNITSIGFYYYDTTASKWTKIVTGSGSGWGLTGNSGTTAGTNFIGTTDNTDFRIKTGTVSTDRWNISHANAGQLQSYSLGTAALPTYSFQGDQDTGIWSSAANKLNFSTNGTERVQIDNAGKVGVNGTPTATLDVNAVNATGVTTNVDGFLAPRVDRQRAQSMASVPAGTMIYVNDATTGTATGTAVNINATGFYYYDTVSSTWVSYSYGQSSTTYYQSAGVNIASTDTSSKSLSLTTGSITIPPNCTVLISYDIGLRTSSAAASGYSAADFQLYMDGTAAANALGTFKRVFSFNTASVINAIGYASSTQSFNISAGSHTIDVLGKWFNGTATGAAGNGAVSSALQGQITVTIIKK